MLFTKPLREFIIQGFDISMNLSASFIFYMLSCMIMDVKKCFNVFFQLQVSFICRLPLTFKKSESPADESQ